MYKLKYKLQGPSHFCTPGKDRENVSFFILQKYIYIYIYIKPKKKRGYLQKNLFKSLSLAKKKNMRQDQGGVRALETMLIKLLIHSKFSLLNEKGFLCWKKKKIRKKFISSFKSSAPSFMVVFTFSLQSTLSAILGDVFGDFSPKRIKNHC